MDILAKLLNDKLSFTEISYSLEEAKSIANSGKIPIIVCSNILKENDPFKHSWDVTSDSISAYIADCLDAKLLIATDVDGIYTREPNIEGSKLINEIDARKLLTFNETSIDLVLPSLLIKFESNCYVVNGNFPGRIIAIINDSITDLSFPYTFIYYK